MNTIGRPYIPQSATPTISNHSNDNQPQTTDSAPGIRTKRGIGATARRWPQHSTITIALNGMTEDQQKLVKQGLGKITPHINLNFKYVPGPDADIRISPSSEKGSNGSSRVGTDAKKAKPLEPTMLFNFNRPPENIIATVVHEGLHAIGVLHEHQHPDRKMSFDETALKPRFEGSKNLEKDIKDNITKIIKRQKNGPTFTQYDPKSIMHYEFTSKELNGAPAIPKNNELSKGDIALLRTLYPPRTGPSIKETIEKLNATVVLNKLWPAVSTVTISLLDMTDEQKKFVTHNIKKLQPYLSTQTQFTDQADGDIRISLSTDGKSWSAIGSDARNIDPSAPTMSLHWGANKKDTARAVKQLFAQALGFTSITLPKNTA